MFFPVTVKKIYKNSQLLQRMKENVTRKELVLLPALSPLYYYEDLSVEVKIFFQIEQC